MPTRHVLTEQGPTRPATDLRQHWRAAMAIVGALRRPGRTGARNPWYLVLGPTGGGKSTLLSHAGLDLRPLLIDTAGTPTGDAPFTLWHNDHALFIEVPGRLVGDAVAQGDWRTLLHLIRRERGHLPLSGVLMVKPLAEQLRAGPAAAANEANLLRERLHDLTRITGAAAPVYVVVTKADLLGGFKEFVAAGERQERTSVFGLTMPWPAEADPTRGVAAEYERLLDSLCDRRLAALAAASSPAAQRRLLQFPAQLRAALPFLSDHLTGALRCAPDGLPTFRGLYFTSVLPAVRAADVVPAADGVVAPPKSLFIGPGSPRPMATATTEAAEPAPLFIRDLFSRVILADTALALPTAGELARWRLLRVACLVVAPVLAALLFLIIGWSAWRGVGLIDDLRQPIAALVEHERSTSRDTTALLLALDHLGEALGAAVDHHGARLGEVGVVAARRYVRSLRPLLLDPCLSAMHTQLAAVRTRGPDTTVPTDLHDLLRTYRMLGRTLEPEPEVIIRALLADPRWFRALDPPGGTCEARIEALARRQLLTCARILVPHGLMPVEIDRPLGDALTREFGEQILIQQSYDEIMLQLTPTFGVVRPADLLGDPAHSPLTIPEPISLIYSQVAWDTAVAKALERKAADLGPVMEGLHLPHDRAVVAERLGALFVADHQRRWRAVIASPRAALIRDFRDTPAQLDRICGADSPYPRFIAQALGRLALDRDGGVAAREPEVAWVAPCLHLIAGLQQDALGLQPLGGDAGMASMAERFRTFAARIATVSARISDVLASVQPVETRTAIHQGFDSILRSLVGSLDRQIAAELEHRWAGVHRTHGERFAARYPCLRTATDEVTQAEFEAFFNPATGTMTATLAQFATLRDVRLLGRAVLTLGDDYERTQRWLRSVQAVFFTDGSPTLQVRFGYRLQQREQVRDLRFQIGTRTTSLYERPDARYLAEIRRGDPTGARISLQAVTGQWKHREEATGDWGFLRLLQAGNPRAATGGDVVCTWEHDSPVGDRPVTLKASVVLEAGGIDAVVAGDLLGGFALPARLGQADQPR